MDVSALDLARFQFAFTVSAHIIFPAFSIGLASYLAVLEGLWLWTGHEIYLRAFKYWIKIFAIVFGATLRAGATPLISVLAERVQGPLPPAVQRYTRRLTAVWVVYFAGMTVLSLALYAWAPWWWWSLYANVLTPLAAGALFFGEFALRYRLHPEFQRVSLMQTLHAYRASPWVATPRREQP